MLFHASIGHKICCYRPTTLFSVGDFSVRSLEVSSLNHVAAFSNKQRGSDESLQYVAHSGIAHHLDIAWQHELANLQVGLSNRQDKVKGHHLIALQVDSFAFGTQKNAQTYTPNSCYDFPASCIDFKKSNITIMIIHISVHREKH